MPQVPHIEPHSRNVEERKESNATNQWRSIRRTNMKGNDKVNRGGEGNYGTGILI
jgi:hypothetical protein